jgi:hypothetical protein
MFSNFQRRRINRDSSKRVNVFKNSKKTYRGGREDDSASKSVPEGLGT